MYDSELYRRMRAEVDKIKIIDTHEHLTLPDSLVEAGKLDFGRLITHYARCDLISAGMPPDDMAKVADPKSDWSPIEKWRALKPWYEKSWNTAYCECLRIAMRDIHGIEDLRDDTVEPLSEKMNGVERASHTRTVFDRAGIEIAMFNGTSVPVYHRRRYPGLFLYDMCDDFSTLGRIPEMRTDTGLGITSLDGFLEAVDWYFDKFADEASALKIGRAYDRTLFFDEVSKDDASRICDRVLVDRESVPAEEIRALEDFVIHYCMGKCGDHDLPVKIHTGLQEGNGNDITNSRAALLINLFRKYPGTEFDIFHISWPYTEELTAICKNFPNVYVDFCWAWIFNPPGARRWLADMLETIPLNKIHGFGGDFVFVEGTYGHSVIARREIARVLAEKVEEGRFTEEYAVRAAQRILRDNPMENFRVREKQRIYAERAKMEAQP
jgi:hypothetical protein